MSPISRPSIIHLHLIQLDLTAILRWNDRNVQCQPINNPDTLCRNMIHGRSLFWTINRTKEKPLPSHSLPNVLRQRQHLFFLQASPNELESHGCMVVCFSIIWTDVSEYDPYQDGRLPRRCTHIRPGSSDPPRSGPADPNGARRPSGRRESPGIPRLCNPKG